MKKTISLLLVLVVVVGVCLSLCACSSLSKSDVVGVWETLEEHPPYMEYMYVYKDGSGDFYGLHMGDTSHSTSFEWKIDGEYFCRTSSLGGTSKYTVKDGCMYNRQGKLAFKLVSNDTSKDIPIN